MKTNLIAILIILLSGWLMFIPATVGNSQNPPVAPMPSIESLKERGNQLDQNLEMKMEKLKEVVSESQPQKPTKKKSVPKSDIEESPPGNPEFILRVNNKLTYELDPILYKGVYIADVYLDTLNRDWEAEQECIDLAPVCTLSNMPKDATEKRSWFKKAIDFILFRKHKTSKQ